MSFAEVAACVGPLTRDGVFATQPRRLNGVSFSVSYRFINDRLQSIDLTGSRKYATNREAFPSHRKFVEWIEERAGPRELGGRGTHSEEFLWGLPSATIRTQCYVRIHATFDIPNPRDRFGPRLRDLRDRTKNLG